MEGCYDRGYWDGYDDAENEYRTPIPWLLGGVYRLSDGDDYAFGYNVAVAENQFTHPLFFYNLIKHEYTVEAQDFVGRFGFGIDFNYQDFIRGYVAYGEYVRDVYVPSWQEEVPDQADYIEEMYKEPIACYLSVKGDV